MKLASPEELRAFVAKLPVTMPLPGLRRGRSCAVHHLIGNEVVNAIRAGVGRERGIEVCSECLAGVQLRLGITIRKAKR